MFVLCTFSVGHIKCSLRWDPTLVVERLFWVKINFSQDHLESRVNKVAGDGKQAIFESAQIRQFFNVGRTQLPWECHEAQKKMTAVSQSFIVGVLSNYNPQNLSFV